MSAPVDDFSGMSALSAKWRRAAARQESVFLYDDRDAVEAQTLTDCADELDAAIAKATGGQP